MLSYILQIDELVNAKCFMLKIKRRAKQKNLPVPKDMKAKIQVYKDIAAPYILKFSVSKDGMSKLLTSCLIEDNIILTSLEWGGSDMFRG